MPTEDKRKRSRNVVKDFELKISAGQRVGLSGPERRWQDDVDGPAHAACTTWPKARFASTARTFAKSRQESLRRSIALIPQDTTLFHRNLIENIRYGRPGATDAEV